MGFRTESEQGEEGTITHVCKWYPDPLWVHLLRVAVLAAPFVAYWLLS